MKQFFVAAAAVAALALPHAFAETPCKGSPLSGTVLDATQALVPGATVVLDGRVKVKKGLFTFNRSFHYEGKQDLSSLMSTP